MRLTILSSTALLSSVLVLHAQPGATPPAVTTRPMSLNDCIRMALERNLTIMVGDSVKLGDTADLDVNTFGKLGLQQAHLELEGLYGYYDPLFFSRVGQVYEDNPGTIDGTGIRTAARKSWNEIFEFGVDGNLPGGTRYKLAAETTRTSYDELQPLGPSSGFRYAPFVGITVTQPLLKDFWIDRGRLNIRLAKVEVNQSEQRFRLLVMNVVNQVAGYYFDYLAARDEIKVQEKALELANLLVTDNKNKVAAGTIAPLEARQSESQAATAKAALTDAIFAAQEAENLLKAVITHEFNTIQPINIEPTEKLIAVYRAQSLAESWRTALEQRPDYVLAKQDLENRQIALSFYKNQLYPALDIQGTYGRNGLANDSKASYDDIWDNRYPTWGGFVVFSVPITRKAERSNYKSAKVSKEAAILSLKRKEDSVLQEVDIAVKAVISRYQAIESTRQARLFAEEALQAEQNKLENGKSTSFNVLQFQRDLTTASSAEIRALADYNKALHQLYFREGTTLERNKITLELR
jgi:outer membrane protein TolC